MIKKHQKLLKQYKKTIQKERVFLLKKLLFFRKKFNLFYKKINWHKISFALIIAFIFICFIGFWQYSLISAKGFIKIFPKTAQGDFQNLHEILTLSNSETDKINTFNQSNSAFPLGYMKENIYSFEVNLRPEDTTVVLPVATTLPDINSINITTPPTTLGNTEIISIVTTTTTLPSPTTTTKSIETTDTTTSTLPPTETSPTTTTTTTLPLLPTAMKKTKPFINFINNNFKNISLLGFISELVSETIKSAEQKGINPVSSEVILSGFVLPELLEDEVLTQFDDKKSEHDILNVKLGLSFANRHFDPNTDANLIIEILNDNEWKKIDTIKLKNEMSNGHIGSYYYIELGAINSVQDIEELKVKITYLSSSPVDSDRLYIDSSWIEVAINSDLEAIINDNSSEVEIKLFTKSEEFYDFDQEVVITIQKEQTKPQKVYKENLVAEDNIVETNSKTIILEPTTGSTSSDSGPSEEEQVKANESQTEPDSDTTKTNDDQIVESIVVEGDSGTTNSANSSKPSEGQADSQESQPANEPVLTDSPSEVPAEASAPASSPAVDSPSSGEGPTTWLNRTLRFINSFSKKLIASVLDLAEESLVNTEPTTTTLLEPSPTTLPVVTTLLETTTPTTLPVVATLLETTTPTTTFMPTTTTNPEEISSKQNIPTPETTTPTSDEVLQDNYRPKEDNSLVVREEIVVMENFKVRSAILSTPDRRKFRNNISISENEKEYIVTIKHGPDLVPGKYNLIIKHQDKDGFYVDNVNFVWGGEVIKDIKILDNIQSYFVKNHEDKQVIYLQIKLEENLFYNLKVQDIVIPLETPIGFIENNFVFIDENNNLQGLDILSNSFFSQVLEYNRDNYFSINNKKYLIKIENGMILFIKENN